MALPFVYSGEGAVHFGNPSRPVNEDHDSCSRSHCFGVAETVAATGVGAIDAITGADLRRAREQQGMTLGKLATQVGRSKGHLSKVERDIDHRGVSPALIRDYQRALGVEVSATQGSDLPNGPYPGTVNSGPDSPKAGSNVPPLGGHHTWPAPASGLISCATAVTLSPDRTSQTEIFVSQLTGHIGGMAAAVDTGQALSTQQRDIAFKSMVDLFIDWASTMDRRALLRLFGWAAVAAGTIPSYADSEVSQNERLAVAIQEPSNVDGILIGQFEKVLANCMQQDDSLGPFAVLDTVLIQRGLAGVMLKNCDDAFRSRLLSAYANLSRYAGWLSFDLKDFDGANYYYEDARASAHDAQNAELGALVLCNLSHLATWRGHPRTGIDHAVAAQAWASQTEDFLLRAYAADVAARAYAMDRQEIPCLKQIEVAREYVQKPQAIPTLVPFYNTGLLDSIHGLCLLSLDRPTLAIEKHEKSLEEINPSHVRNLAFNKAYLSMALKRSKNIDAAAATLGDAAELTTHNRSARLVQQVQTVRRELTPWEDSLAVRQLDERLRAYGFPQLN